MRPVEVHSGDKFGNLEIVVEISSGKFGRRFTCRCLLCGSEREYYWRYLRAGDTKGCGCRHSNTKHGGYTTPEYRSWRAMKRRCLDPKDMHYSYYGGAGVTIHPTWIHDFQQFVSDVGKMPHAGMTLERKNNDVGYAPGNVVWATRLEQVRNRRNTRYVVYGGQRTPLREFAARFGVNEQSLWKRLAIYSDVDIAVQETIKVHRGTRKKTED